MNDIVVGVDKSATARRAAETAASLAAALGVNLHVVMCTTRRRSKDISVGGDRWHVDSISEAESFLAGLSRELDHDQITTSVGAENPAAAMCEAASSLDAKMIVVGNRRVQGVSRVLGSIASDVAKQAPCDVLIANTTDA